MHLARTVTQSTLEECKRRMSQAEFRHWQALYRIEPWGDDWQQTRAMAAASIAPYAKKKIKLEKFFPQPPKATPQQTEQMLMVFAKRHNARIERNERRREKNRHAEKRAAGRRNEARQRIARRTKGS